MEDSDKVELRFGWVSELGTDVEVCTWKKFVDVNADGFESNPEEVQEIAKVLDSGNIYLFNGGTTGFHWDEELGMVTGRVSQPKKLGDFFPNYVSLKGGKQR